MPYSGRMEDIMKKTVVTVVGKDSVGIIAKVCTYLANNSVNILDISQLEQIGEEMGCIIKAQREDIFDSMHRI